MKTRKPTVAIDPLFLDRWSPRAMTGETLSHEEILPLFEAARWAPSSYNAQPWRFIYARRETKEFERLFNLLVPFNQSWAHKASLLVVVISKKTFEHNNKPAVTHSFDAGAAWENIALQALTMGLAAHGMQGFDYERARSDLKIPKDYQVEAMIAIGRKARKETLSKELQEKEVRSMRKPLDEIMMEGMFIEK